MIKDNRSCSMAILFAGLLALGFLGPATSRAESPAVKDGDKIAFLGDSITAYGMGSLGYCRLVISGLEANGIKATAIGAGVGGHKSNDMLARVDRDVINKKPDWVTLSCGVNDVWHGANGVPLEPYKTNITAIVDKCQAAGIKVMILTATMIKEDPANAENQKLAAYNDFLRSLAKEKKCLLADLNADMQAAIQQAGTARHGNLLTSDGVHMNTDGNKMMAAGVLKAFGLSDAQIKIAQEKSLDIPDACEAIARVKLSQRKLQQLDALAKKQNRTRDDMMNEELGKIVAALLKDQK
jgi:lysophospholipase L1-like esterase